MKALFPRRSGDGFTMVELLVVMTIIALMLSLSFPAFSRMIEKAKSVKCGQNLRSIGVAVSHAVSDNNNTYPPIDEAAIQIYPAEDNVGGLVSVLGPYGITAETVKCPSNTTTLTRNGSSYEWNPCLDEETPLSPVLFITDTRSIPVKSSRWRLCTDFNYSIHNGRANALYADGHVTTR